MEILYWNWTETQYNLHFVKVASVNAAVLAFVTVAVHYAVSEWIWFGDTGSKRSPHTAPVYLVSSCVFFYLWSTIFNLSLGHFPLGYIIATPIIGLFGGVLFNLAFCWLWTIVFPQADHSEEKEEEKEDQQDREPDAEAPLPATEIETKPVPKAKPKVLYINNIKIFLTAMVVIHHCGMFYGAFFVNQLDPIAEPLSREWLLSGGLSAISYDLFMATNQSYFMFLFFFFSGFFVPKSFDKRGRREFLMGRARRLGIPLVVSTYFLNYFNTVLKSALFREENVFMATERLVAPLVSWFLMMLFIFGIAYAFACGKGWSPKVGCPTLLGFFATSIVLGLVGFVLSICFPDSEVLNYYNGHVLVPLHAVFFFYGAVAQRNNWMEQIQSKSRIAIYSWAILAWLLFAVLKISFFTFEKGPLLDSVVKGFFDGGFLAVPLSLAVTVFFMDLFNKKFFFTDFFAKSMYTVYIIHMYPVIIALHLWYLVLESTGNIIAPITTSLYLVPGNMATPAFFFVATVSMIIVWPLAYAIRSIPGFSKVL